MVLIAGMLSGTPALAKKNALSDDEVKQQIIDDSIADYPGTCACPFNSARNGSSCGRRSAWSKAGGYAPICYKKEVTKQMVTEWRQNNGG
ncbi:hypothetical protein [Duffyella gerundensis]|uniref:hypothetical protein n=1 Tax=Duffyella gerundensis TaxID=1619313 RepID=UPI0021CC729B|nr:hypothetical protein [Duffyella gerundensis]